MPLVRNPGGVSYYCVQQPCCHSPLWQHTAYHPIHTWQHTAYHPIHTWQLDTLTRLTGDSAFTGWADLLRSDWQPPALRSEPPSMPLGWDDAPPQ